MKKSKRFLSLAASAVMFASSIPAISANALTLTTTTTGKDGEYNYELWNQNNAGNAVMNLGSNGTFDCQWNGIENVLFRTGKKFSPEIPYSDLGNVTIDYEADYNLPDQNSYLCVYGWTRNPLIEYYIVDSWGSWRPPGNTADVQKKGEITVDGGTYDVYISQRVNKPSIDGDTTFYQYWSVRQDKRTEGTITVSDHFDAWDKNFGLQMGNLYEIALNVEGYMSNGKATIKKNDITIGGEKKPQEPVKPVEPDENGYFFHSTFEEGTDKWASRGTGVSVKQSSSAACAGNNSLAVSGRTDNWHGASYSLDSKTFVPGNAYSLSAMVMQNAADGEEFKLTLQYNLNGTESYDEIATVTTKKGEWAKLENTSYTIPTGATSMLIYVEATNKTLDFSIDEAIGAKEGVKNPNNGSSAPVTPGTEPTTPGTTEPTTPSTGLKGDVNKDGKVNVKDVLSLRKYLIGLSSDADTSAADVSGDGKVNIIDLVMLKHMLLTNSTPEQPPVTEPPTTTPSNPNPPSSAGFMDSIRNTITNNVPGNISSGTNGCKEERISYYSTVGNCNKNAVVILPEGYSENEKYPVVYVNHGIFGSENDMVGNCKSIGGNLMASGEAEKMIIVSCAMYTGPGSPAMGQINQEVCEKYDAFREDLIQCLMPYMEEHYSIKTGRENTGICGFSMGGRESLYIGITKPEYFGYIGAACPAPGVTPGTDMFMAHPGNMPESEFYIHDHTYDPYMLFIVGGTNDGVVGTFPQGYHNTLTANGQDHLWLEIQGGGHDDSCIKPMMYNFFKNVFKAK